MQDLRIASKEFSPDSPEEEDVMWYPKEKIEYMKRKLRGDNPVYITR